MKTGKYLTVFGALMLLAPAFSSTAYAKSFKAKYYKECYAGVNEVSDLVTPKESMQKKAKKASGLLGSVGSFAGIGGFGGKLSQAASTMQKIEKYSGVIDNVSGFSAQMAEEHPDPNDRFAAYGTHMSTDATNLVKVKAAISDSQTCYDKAFDTLSANLQAGAIKKKKAKKHLKEIQKGSQATGDVLINAMNHINKNMNSYDQVMGGEEQTLSQGFGGMASQFIAGKAGGFAGAAIPSSFAGAAIPAGYTHPGVTAAGAQRAHDRATNVYGLAPTNMPAMATGSPVGNFAILNGLASIAPAAGTTEGVDVQPQPGVQALANSSREYIEIYGTLTKSVEVQRQLEIKVNAGL